MSFAYFGWLQRGNPTGKVDALPELDEHGQTSLPGVYCAGDLTGVPLVNYAADSGHTLAGHIHADPDFERLRQKRLPGVCDILVAGAGPAGISAALRARELGCTVEILESARPFATIAGYPAGKPIHVTGGPPIRAPLPIRDGTKETLLGELERALESARLPVRPDVALSRVRREGDVLVASTTDGELRALRVVLATGRTGNPRRLDVPGADLPHVFTRLIDPAAHRAQSIVVAGGGDSALETALALVSSGNRVTLCHRGPSFSRAKPGNVSALNAAISSGTLTVLLQTSIVRIAIDAVEVATGNDRRSVPADVVYTMLGSDPAIALFEKSGIRIDGRRRGFDWVPAAAMLLCAGMLYFGKKAPATVITDPFAFITLPAHILSFAWHQALAAMAAWVSFVLAAAAAVLLTGHAITHLPQYAGTAWRLTRSVYFGAMFALFGTVYVGHNLMGTNLAGLDPGSWYTLMYSLTVVLFGVRRMVTHRTAYIRTQTLVLMAIQVVPLCVLPMFVLPWMGREGLLSPWVMENVFPGGSYWRAYGFVLAWPLFMANLATGAPATFWLVLSLVQTFVIIPLIVWRWGKGAYCGWICSCGALAETLGDEYRQRAPHGPHPKRIENAGQIVLWAAALVTVAVAVGHVVGIPGDVSDQLDHVYTLAVDVFLSGVLGVGLYVALSGRTWCRFFCPLAALMHLYARFSAYRIFSDKSRCISCGICTRVCHMGIDVATYARQGIPMDDVQCVRCSACVQSCPLDVLSFGRTR